MRLPSRKSAPDGADMFLRLQGSKPDMSVSSLLCFISFPRNPFLYCLSLRTNLSSAPSRSHCDQETLEANLVLPIKRGNLSRFNCQFAETTEPTKFDSAARSYAYESCAFVAPSRVSKLSFGLPSTMSNTKL